MYTQILSYATGKEQQLGVVRVVNGQLHTEGGLPLLLLKTLEFEHQHWTDKGYTDEQFLRQLPQAFKGAFTRARFVAEG